MKTTFFWSYKKYVLTGCG